MIWEEKKRKVEMGDEKGNCINKMFGVVRFFLARNGERGVEFFLLVGMCK
jgi:hypothetical protein